MAPEAKFNEPQDFISDMYSLGLILHFMLSKELPKYLNSEREKFDIDMNLYS